MTTAGPPPDLREVEVFFRRNGLPHLAESPDFREETLRRLRPVAVALAIAAIVLAVLLDLSWWERVLVIGLPILLLGALSYSLVSFGVLALIAHQGRPALSGLRATTSVAIRALPPLLAVLLFLSLAQETWRAFGQLEGWRFGAVLVGFGLLCSIILIAGLRRERSALYAPVPGAELEAAARLTPAAPLVGAGIAPATPPLDRLARINVAVSLFVALGVRVLAVGVAVGVAFMVFGLLIVDRELTAEWVGERPNVLLDVSISGREVIVSEALVRVAAILGGFAALYFVAVALGDKRNREQFLDDELDRMERVMAAWSYYRGALAARVTAPAARGAPG